MKEDETIRLWSWSAMWSDLNAACDMAGLAHSTGALRRGRKITSAEDLLRTVLLWAVGGKSLNQTLLTRAELGGATMSKQSLQERLAGCGRWLEAIVAALLGGARQEAGSAAGPPVTIVDATCLSRPGATGTDVRLHVLYDLASCRLVDVQVTDARGGERLDRFPLQPGEIRLADAGHASPAGLRHVLASHGHLLMRVGWNSLAWRDGAGEALDLVAALSATLDASFEHELWVADGQRRDAEPIKVRVVARRRPPEAAEKSRRRLRQDAKRKGRTPDWRSLQACDWQILLTTLPADQWPLERLFALYPLRWQIELAFKRMKSIGGIADIALRNAEVLRSWVAAHLIAALLQDRAIQEDWGDSFPSAPTRPSHLAVESRSLAARAFPRRAALAR